VRLGGAGADLCGLITTPEWRARISDSRAVEKLILDGLYGLGLDHNPKGDSTCAV
jgi:hypothetical protein